MKLTYKKFEKAKVAQSNYIEDGYERAGYVICVVGNVAGISDYAHCSCFGTYSCLGGDESGGIAFTLECSVDEMYAMAKRMADPGMPTREATQKDVDFLGLTECYAEYTTWYESRPRPTPTPEEVGV
jgi:hypothetical protein